MKAHLVKYYNKVFGTNYHSEVCFQVENETDAEIDIRKCFYEWYFMQTSMGFYKCNVMGYPTISSIELVDL